MAMSYTELTQPTSEEDMLRKLLELATLAGFPATSWQSGSVPRTLLELEGTVLAELTTLIASIGAGGLLDDASGDWLTLLARSQFAEERSAPVRTRGTVVLTCSALAGPYTIAVGQLWATTAAGRRFRNITGGTLASGGTLAVTFEAEEPGAEWNVAAGSLTILLTPLAGVTINNPVDLSSGTWITQTGAPEETDEQLKTRCRAKWATLGTGSTADSYAFWARAASSEVRRVKVLEHSDEGTPTDGHVTVYLAGETGTVGAQAVTDVTAYIAARRPLCVTVHVVAATAVPLGITATQYVRAGFQAAAAAQVSEYLDELERSLGIGETAFRSAIIEQLMRPEGMVNSILAVPAADATLAFNEVHEFLEATLTWHEV